MATMKYRELPRKIAHGIMEMIQVGEIQGGDHLSTQQLADQFGVSRSPVRDAMQYLSDIGILERRVNCGFFALEGASDGVHDLIDNASQGLLESSSYQLLAEDWLNDQIPDEMTENQLRSRYKLTKSELGDILVRATREGWAEQKPGYGWRFLPVAKTAESFEQIYRFRMLIEPAAMLEPTFSADRKILANLRNAQERLLDTNIERLSEERLLNAGSEFHENLIKLSGNPFFHFSLVRVNRMRRLLEYRSKVDRERLFVQCQQHIDIIELLEKGEVMDASYALRTHLGGALNKKSPVDWNSK